jgi:hypothetical protein
LGGKGEGATIAADALLGADGDQLGGGTRSTGQQKRRNREAASS